MGSKSDKVKTDEQLAIGAATGTFMQAVPGLPPGLTINDHHDGGYIVTGAHGFESYLGSPLACPSLEEYLEQVRYIVTEYQKHLWKIIQGLG